MGTEFTEKAWSEFGYWIDNDPAVVERIKELLDAIQKSPFSGIGKPEPLRHNLRGFWSRRITGEHRLAYEISGKKGSDQRCSVIQCRFHYDRK